MRVLVVDDSATQRSLIRIFLSGYHFDFLEAANGIEGLSVARAADELDLIVTDLNMPQMDGVEFVKRLRQSDLSRFRRVPIIVLTAERSTDWFDRAKAAGADAYCRKPVSQSDLLATVAAQLRLSSLPPPSGPKSPLPPR